MGSKLVAFRCPVALMRRVDTVASALGTTRSSVIIEAVRMLSQEARTRGGRLVPPYKSDVLRQLQLNPRRSPGGSVETVN